MEGPPTELEGNTIVPVYAIEPAERRGRRSLQGVSEGFPHVCRAGACSRRRSFCGLRGRIWDTYILLLYRFTPSKEILRFAQDDRRRENLIQYIPRGMGQSPIRVKLLRHFSRKVPVPRVPAPLVTARCRWRILLRANVLCNRLCR